MLEDGGVKVVKSAVLGMLLHAKLLGRSLHQPDHQHATPTLPVLQ